MRKKEPICPLLKKPCIENECIWYVRIRGINPQTGQDVDEYGCTMSWMPILTIENSQQQRSTGASVESFRNEMVKNQNEFMLLAQTSQLNKQLPGSANQPIKQIEG